MEGVQQASSVPSQSQRLCQGETHHININHVTSLSDTTLYLTLWKSRNWRKQPTFLTVSSFPSLSISFSCAWSNSLQKQQNQLIKCDACAQSHQLEAMQSDPNLRLMTLSLLASHYFSQIQGCWHHHYCLSLIQSSWQNYHYCLSPIWGY